MFQFIRRKIGVKLFLVFTLIFIFAAIILISVSTALVKDFGDFAISQNSNNIENQAYNYLSKITEEQTEKYNSYFQQAADFSSSISKQAEKVLNNRQLYSDQLYRNEVLELFYEKGIYSNSKDAELSVIYLDDPSLLNILSQIMPTGIGIELFKKKLSVPKPLVVFKCKKCSGSFEEENYKNNGNSCTFCGSKNVEEIK